MDRKQVLEYVSIAMGISASLASIISLFNTDNTAIPLFIFLGGLLLVSGLLYLLFKIYSSGLTSFPVVTSIFIFLFTGVAIWWFWPSSIYLTVYHDENNNFKRDLGESPGNKEKIIIKYLGSGNKFEDKITEDGTLTYPKVEEKNICILIRDIYIEKTLKRGKNKFAIGLRWDDSPPKTCIKISNDLHGIDTRRILVGETVFVHISAIDPESDIKTIDVKMENPRGNTVTKTYTKGTDPELKFHVVFTKQLHELKAGKYRIYVNAINDKQLKSTDCKESEDGKNYADFEMSQQL